MNYLIYIEYSAENLQFFLWYRDYSKKFAVLPSNEQALAPEWSMEQAEAEALASQANPTAGPKIMSKETAAVFKGTDFAPASTPLYEIKGDPFNTPPMTPGMDGGESVTPSEYAWSENVSVGKSPGKSFQQRAAGAFADAELKWQPCEHIGSCSVFASTLKSIQLRSSLSEKKSLVSLPSTLRTALLDS